LRKAAVESLGNIRDDRAVEPLINTLKDHEQDVRQAAAEALGKLGDTRAVEPLIDTLKEDNQGMHDAVVAALVKIGSPAVVVLISRLKDGVEPQVMAEALGKIGDPRAVQPLLDYLDIERKTAAYALVNIYQSGKLDDQSKQKILWSRNKISQNDHYDMVFKDCDLHSEHDDRGFAGININWSQ
jgi:HEAT repeat protein